MYSIILASVLVTGGAAEQWHCRGCHCGGGHSMGGNPWGWGTWNYCSGCFGAYGCWGGTYSGCSGCSCSGCHGCYGCGGSYGNCNGWGCYGSSYSYGAYAPPAAYALYGNYLYCSGGWHGSYVTCSGCYGCYGGWSCYGTPLTTTYTPVAPNPDRGTTTPPQPPITTPPTMIPGVPNKPSIKIEEAPLPRDKKPGDTSSEVSNRSTVVVEVPADARVYIDGQLMRSTATPRVYHTPELKDGETYFYDIKVEIVRDGRTITQDRRVILTPQARVVARFNEMDAAQPATARSDEE